MVLYVGMMDQDGIQPLIESIEYMVRQTRREDTRLY
jgi:hypothetical protein